MCLCSLMLNDCLLFIDLMVVCSIWMLIELLMGIGVVVNVVRVDFVLSRLIKCFVLWLLGLVILV